ncbi:MAG: transposase, partial [Pseudolabrys sp.]
ADVDLRSLIRVPGSGPWPAAAVVVRGHTESDRRVVGPADHRGISLDISPSYLVRDNDRAYGHVFTFRVGAMGIRDRPISPASPWQNGYAERLIGTLRRECLDQVVIFGEAHLRRILSAYAAYYNQVRTHLALQKDAPFHRTAQRSGTIVAIPILAGLHHEYARI